MGHVERRKVVAGAANQWAATRGRTDPEDHTNSARAGSALPRWARTLALGNQPGRDPESSTSVGVNDPVPRKTLKRRVTSPIVDQNDV